ncbi:Hypothetical predicted protein, partial [Pelobates cultripes]
ENKRLLTKMHTHTSPRATTPRGGTSRHAPQEQAPRSRIGKTRDRTHYQGIDPDAWTPTTARQARRHTTGEQSTRITGGAVDRRSPTPKPSHHDQ